MCSNKKIKNNYLKLSVPVIFKLYDKYLSSDHFSLQEYIFIIFFFAN